MAAALRSPLSPTSSGRAYSVSFLSRPEESPIVPGHTSPTGSCPWVNPVNRGTPGWISSLSRSPGRAGAEPFVREFSVRGT